MNNDRSDRFGVQFCVVASFCIAVIPLYGFYSHVARDSQLTVLVLMLAWVVSLLSTVAWIVYSITSRKTYPLRSLLAVAMIVAQIGLLIGGYFGIGEAIMELWA